MFAKVLWHQLWSPNSNFEVSKVWELKFLSPEYFASELLQQFQSILPYELE